MNAKEREELQLVKMGFEKMTDGFFKRGSIFIEKLKPIWHNDKIVSKGDSDWHVWDSTKPKSERIKINSLSKLNEKL